ncbi:MAG: winged helix-turn-helix transcriptional regulator [Nitrososphaerota archaeon]|nr:winged helix-turn-helix transcriptional regulator [Nitrososphaerota archaeon]
MEQFSVCVPLVFGVGLHSNSSHPLEQPTRQEIYSFIKDNPGVHFRGICSALHLSIGMVQYHLTVLEHADLVVVYNDGQTKRYFEDKLFTVEEMRLFSLMRHETTSKIITILAQNESVVHRDIAFALNVSSQAVTWQMNQLKKAELISSEKTGVNIKYTLNDPDTLKKILT